MGLIEKEFNTLLLPHHKQGMVYLMDLSHLILDKASGGSLQGHPAVLRLVEIRTV